MATEFTIHTKETAPDAAKAWLDVSVQEFGRVPNLHGVMAEAPISLEAYHRLWGLFGKESSFTPEEQQIVYQTSNVLNDCHYCVPAHAGLMMSIGIDREVIDRLVKQEPLADPRHEALRVFTAAMVEKRGHVSNEQIEAFLDAGWERRHILEVIVGLATKVLSNYTNAVAGTEMDAGIKQVAESLGLQQAAT